MDAMAAVDGSSAGDGATGGGATGGGATGDGATGDGGTGMGRGAGSSGTTYGVSAAPQCINVGTASPSASRTGRRGVSEERAARDPIWKHGT